MENIRPICRSLVYIACLLTISFVSSCTSCSNYEVSVQNTNDEKEISVKPVLNVYIENSGSMDGYFSGKSDMRDDLYGYVSELKGSTSGQNLFYINSTIIPIRQNTEAFFMGLNANSFKAGGGNRTHSNIIDMMKMMLSKSNSNTVSMFVSDCILDLPSVDTKTFLDFEKTSLANTLRDYKNKHKDFGVRILCMQSSFNGFLFPAGQTAIKTVGKRPYYIWILGSNKLISKLMSIDSDAKLGSNLQNCVAYSDASSLPINIGKTKGPMSTNGVVNLKGGNLKFDLYVNFSSSLLDEKSIEDKGTYDISPFLELQNIQKINYVGAKYSHVLTFELQHASKADNAQITIIKDVPAWVKSMNDETGDKPKKTCGIKYLIEGAKEAFDADKPVTINLQISKK